jgi:hypothetical protein
LKYAGVSTPRSRRTSGGADDLDHLVGADLIGEGRLERGRQDLEPGLGVRGEQRLEEAHVEAVERTHRVDDGVLGGQLEHHGDVAELQVGVDQGDRALGPLRQQHAQVGGHHGLARAALGGEHGDDPTEVAAVGVEARPTDGGRTAAGDQGLTDAADGLVELAGVHRRPQHVADPGAHGPLEQVGGEVLGDQDGADVGPTPQQGLGPTEVRAAGAARAQDQHEGGGTVALLDALHGLQRDRMLTELHHQTATNSRVCLDDQHRHIRFGGREVRHGSERGRSVGDPVDRRPKGTRSGEGS